MSGQSGTDVGQMTWPGILPLLPQVKASCIYYSMRSPSEAICNDSASHKKNYIRGQTAIKSSVLRHCFPHMPASCKFIDAKKRIKAKEEAAMKPKLYAYYICMYAYVICIHITCR
jgi:hypothetical protein